jgi:hypothetical protein
VVLKTKAPTGRRHHRETQIRVNAADDLRFIREAVEHSSRFTDVPGAGMIVIGCTALLTTWLADLQSDERLWLATWAIEGFVAVAIGLAAVALKAAGHGSTLLALPTRKFFLGLLPALVAGAVLTAVLADGGRYDLIPGAWLLLYGTAVASAGAHSVRVIPIEGICFMLLGVVALLAPGQNDIALALGFGGLHIAFGVVIARRYGG